MDVELTGALTPVPDLPGEPAPEASRHIEPGPDADRSRGAPGTGAGRVLALASAVPALVLVGWLAAVYPLARAGLATPVAALAAAVPVIAVLVGLARRLPPVPNTPWWAVVATLAVVAVFAVVAGVLHGEHLVLRRDPGVYALTAHWLADHGGLVIPTDVAAAGGPSPAFTVASPGFYQVGDAVVPQFMSGAPIALLPGAWLAGWTGILTMSAGYAALALLAVAGLVGRLVGPRWAPVGALVLGVCQPIMLAARGTVSEVAAQLLLLGGLCLLVDAVSSQRRARVLAALAGLAVGFGLLVRVEAAREILLLIPVIGWLAIRRRPQWVPLAGGLAAGAAFGVLDAVGPSRQYILDLEDVVRPLIGLGAALAVATVALVVATRRSAALRRLLTHRTGLAAGAAVLVVGAGGYLFARPWLQTVHYRVADSARIVASLQRAQGLPVDPARSYAEQSVRWVSWYVGWPALAAAGVAAAVLTWRIVRCADDRWAVALPVPLVSAALVLYRPGITPDHPWADRRLVVTVLPVATLLAVAALAAVTRALRGRWSRPGLGGGPALAVAAIGVAVLVVPAARASAPLASARTETGEPAAVEMACAGFGPGDVALLVDARSRQEWTPALRQVCDTPTFGVPGYPTDNTASPAEVATVAARVRAAGGNPVLVAASGGALPHLARAPQRQVVRLATAEHDRRLTQPATRLAPLSVELWIAPAD